MTDALKPDMLDSVDKPSASMLAQAYCATVVSNLEGWRGGVLPCTRERRGATIDQLDARVRRLESVDAINPPPPMDTPSWDSLMWRVARLHRKMPGGAAVNRMCGSPPLITPTMTLLRSTLAAIGGVGPQSWAVFAEEADLEEDDVLQVAAQFLCHLAGKRGFKIVGSFELKQNCKLALELSLDTDMNSGFYVGPAFHVPRQRLDVGVVPRAGLLPLQKSCCGCCACSCHNINRAPKPGVLKWMTGKYHEERRARKMGVKARITRVFRKLAFWRRRRVSETDSDVSSITTRTSSTFG
ncbi:hypothetical protein F4823DRAFT_566261 [Ustulina deusta]|nr:hypothetical protein F4823DRAFT_566261 [Ustulina deusta]